MIRAHFSLRDPAEVCCVCEENRLVESAIKNIAAPTVSCMCIGCLSRFFKDSSILEGRCAKCHSPYDYSKIVEYIARSFLEDAPQARRRGKGASRKTGRSGATPKNTELKRLGLLSLADTATLEFLLYSLRLGKADLALFTTNIGGVVAAGDKGTAIKELIGMASRVLENWGDDRMPTLCEIKRCKSSDRRRAFLYRTALKLSGTASRHSIDTMKEICGSSTHVNLSRREFVFAAVVPLIERATDPELAEIGELLWLTVRDIGDLRHPVLRYITKCLYLCRPCSETFNWRMMEYIFFTDNACKNNEDRNINCNHNEDIESNHNKDKNINSSHSDGGTGFCDNFPVNTSNFTLNLGKTYAVILRVIGTLPRDEQKECKIRLYLMTEALHKRIRMSVPSLAPLANLFEITGMDSALAPIQAALAEEIDRKVRGFASYGNAVKDVEFTELINRERIYDFIFAVPKRFGEEKRVHQFIYALLNCNEIEENINVCYKMLYYNIIGPDYHEGIVTKALLGYIKDGNRESSAGLAYLSAYIAYIMIQYEKGETLKSLGRYVGVYKDCLEKFKDTIGDYWGGDKVYTTRAYIYGLHLRLSQLLRKDEDRDSEYTIPSPPYARWHLICKFLRDFHRYSTTPYIRKTADDSLKWILSEIIPLGDAMFARIKGEFGLKRFNSLGKLGDNIPEEVRETDFYFCKTITSVSNRFIFAILENQMAPEDFYRDYFGDNNNETVGTWFLMCYFKRLCLVRAKARGTIPLSLRMLQEDKNYTSARGHERRELQRETIKLLKDFHYSMCQRAARIARNEREIKRAFLGLIDRLMAVDFHETLDFQIGKISEPLKDILELILALYIERVSTTKNITTKNASTKKNIHTSAQYVKAMQEIVSQKELEDGME